MEFRQIQYFITLYEDGSVTRAARRLHIVQSALSMQMAKLEAEVGQRLFVRTPQGMQPTPAAMNAATAAAAAISGQQCGVAGMGMGGMPASPGTPSTGGARGQRREPDAATGARSED